MVSVFYSLFPPTSKSGLRTHSRTDMHSLGSTAAQPPAPCPQPRASIDPPGLFPREAQRSAEADVSLLLCAFLGEWVLETRSLQATLKSCRVPSPLVAAREARRERELTGEREAASRAWLPSSPRASAFRAFISGCLRTACTLRLLQREQPRQAAAAAGRGDAIAAGTVPSTHTVTQRSDKPSWWPCLGHAWWR